MANQFNFVPDLLGSVGRGLNLGEQFRTQRIQRRQQEFLEGGGLQQPQAVQSSAKLGLDFQAKVAQGLGLIDQRTGAVNQQRLTKAADFSFRIQNLPLEQQNIAINERIVQLEAEGADATQTRELLNIPQEQRAQALSAVQLAALPNEQRLAVIKGLQPGTDQRFFESLLVGLPPEERERANQIRLRLLPGATGSAAQTITELGTADVVAQTEETLAAGREEGRLQAQQELLPAIRGAIRQAEKESTDRGETFTDLARAKAALPGLKEVTNKLKLLADVATVTLVGRSFDFLTRELGFGANKGATARSTMRAIVDNQVLPLLRDTFGAAFTKEEGDSLRNTLLDQNTAPEQMKATLDAFIDQKVRNIETKEAELGVEKSTAQILIDAQTEAELSTPETQRPGGTFTSPGGIIFTVE